MPAVIHLKRPNFERPDYNRPNFKPSDFRLQKSSLQASSVRTSSCQTLSVQTSGIKPSINQTSNFLGAAAPRAAPAADPQDSSPELDLQLLAFRMSDFSAGHGTFPNGTALGRAFRLRGRAVCVRQFAAFNFLGKGAVQHPAAFCEPRHERSQIRSNYEV